MKQLFVQAKKEYGVEAIIVGAVRSDYQQMRVNHICEDVGLKTFAPLWHVDQEQLLEEMIDAGFDIRIIHIAAYGLDKSFLGKRIDTEILTRLKALHQQYQIHVAGEGGEFETFVVNGPIFKKPLEITDAEIVMEDEHTGTFLIHSVM